MSLFDRVFLDFDDLIARTEMVASMAYEGVLRQCGIVPILNEFGLVHTPGIIGNMALLKEKYRINRELSDLKMEWERYYLSNISSRVRLRPGILSLIRMLNERNQLMGIVSAGHRQCIENVLNDFRLRHFFSPIVYGFPEKRLAYLHALREAGADPRRSLAIEDSLSGVQAAKAARIKHVIAVPTEYTRNQNFDDEADEIVQNPGAITWNLLVEISSKSQ